MTEYRFTDATERVYHDYGLVEPGDTRDLPADPGDGRWSAVTKSATPKDADNDQS